MSTDTNIKSFPCWSTSDTLTVEPEFPDEPDLSGVYIGIKRDGAETGWATNDPAVAKQLIEHIAKLAHLTVTFEEPEPKIEDFRPLDRVRITTTEGNLKGEMATVVAITPGTAYPIEVRTDSEQRFDVRPSEIRKESM